MNNVTSALMNLGHDFLEVNKTFKPVGWFVASTVGMTVMNSLMPVRKPAAQNRSLWDQECEKMEAKHHGIQTYLSDYQSEIAWCMGSVFLRCSGKTLCLNKWYAENDPQATLFFMRREVRLLEKDAKLFRGSVLLVCDVASAIFSPAPICFQLGAHLTIGEWLRKRQENDATTFAIEKAGKEELEGAIRVCHAKVEYDNERTRQTSFAKKVVNFIADVKTRDSSFVDLLRRVEKAYIDHHFGTAQDIAQIKNSDLTKKLGAHLRQKPAPLFDQQPRPAPRNICEKVNRWLFG